MKKTRNSFFSESNMYAQNFNPNMNMPGMPYQAQTAYNSYYSGPNPNLMTSDNDLESRLAKMERQINRLEHRISKLEQTSSTLIDDYDTNTTNMYML